MTNRLELNWKLDGFIDEQRYYCSETPIDPENLPLPKAVLAGDVRTYTDIDVEVGKTYYVAVSSVKNAIEKFSEIKNLDLRWNPDWLGMKARFSAQKAISSSSNIVTGLVNIDNSIANLIPGKTGAALTEYNSSLRKLQCSKNQGYRITESKNWLRNKSQWYMLAVVNPAYSTEDSVLMALPTGLATGVRAALMTSSGKFYFGGRRLDADSWSRIFSPLSYSKNVILVGVANTLTRTLQLYINGVLVAETNTWQTAGITQDTDALMDVGVLSYSDGTNGFAGDAFFLAFSNTELTTTDRQKFEGWAAHTYGLTSSLPAGHPYKTSAPNS